MIRPAAHWASEVEFQAGPGEARQAWAARGSSAFGESGARQIQERRTEWMASGIPVLVIGAESLRDALLRALPHVDLRWSDNPLQGVWLFGAAPCERVVLSAEIGAVLGRVIESLRQLAPDARIIVVGRPHLEPFARQMLQRGATDYALDPLARDEIQSLLGLAGDEPSKVRQPMHPAEPNPAAGSDAPTAGELAALGQILQSLGDGPRATLDRLCAWVAEAIGAAGVAIESESFTSSVGASREPFVQPIERAGRVVGRLEISGGTGDPPRLARRAAAYARLIDACMLQAREQQQLRDLASTDHLTGLKNRRYFEESLRSLVDRAAADRSSVTLLLFDIDDFKSYNDRFGYEVGDGLLREISVLLSGCCREQDVVARFGGDEFAVVFWDAQEPRVPGSTHPTAPTALAERFHRALTEHQFKCLGPHAPASVTISGGLASFPWDGRSAAELVRAAERALREAKGVGKNRIQIASGKPGE
ncbi:MAG: GGDEF domain-containing protein [Phycisphaerales bacterium]|nr:GGDEF domain-containing protein [Phycisphaerales bacterium]